jgi:hypothetical protein
MQLQYNITSGLALGPVFRMTGNQYHGNPEAWDMKEPKLEIRDLTTGLCLTTRPGKWLAAELEGGLAYGRKFEFHDAGNLVLDLKPGSTWYVSCGVQISRPGM